MKIKASIVRSDGSWTVGRRLLVVHQPPRKGEWVELHEENWYEVVNVVHRGFGFNPDFADQKTAENRLAPYGDKLGTMEDLPDMETVDVIVLLRPIDAPNPVPGWTTD